MGGVGSDKPSGALEPLGSQSGLVILGESLVVARAVEAARAT